MTPEELEQLAQALQGLEASDLEALRQGLIESAALEGLASSIQAAISALSGSPEGGSGGSSLEEALRRIDADSRAVPAGGEGEGLGPQPGRGSGGVATRAPDDGRPEKPERVGGRPDPKGRHAPPVRFRGLPAANESKEVLEAALQAAAAAAEESLGRDEIPPAARPVVRRYFEALRSGGGRR